jgi:nitrate reductase delta subunit
MKEKAGSRTFLEEFNMIRTYKILSLLLTYPESGLEEFLPEALSALKNEALLHQVKIDEAERFIQHFSNMGLTDWQAEYVQLFDNSRSASLYLFEHVKGDSKDRGQAMVDLMEFYRENGMQLSSNELPDYLPVFLEFLSTRDKDEAAELLAGTAHIIERISQALKEKDHPYHYVLSAIVSLSSRQPDAKATGEIIRNEKPLDLDAEYGDEPIEFSINNDCTNCKS